MTQTLEQPVAAEAKPPRSRPTWPGILSFAFGIATLAGLITGIVLATSDQYLAATYAAWAACATGAIAALLGLLALALRRARGWAVAGILLGMVFNPPLLTAALGGIGGLW